MGLDSRAARRASSARPMQRVDAIERRNHGHIARLASSVRRRREGPTNECVLVLQGGGALGSYQAGVFEALSAKRIAPGWIAGISIGAINGALIAGNPPERRVERLREFWEHVTSGMPQPPLPTNGTPRAALNQLSALRALALGAPGFFSPWLPPAPLQPAGTPQAISYYDTEPLRSTLDELVDFGYLNEGHVRLSVGAVNVRTSNLTYFDSAKQRIDARHIMASGALPPGFPPVEIDGELYWDGGLVSNTPFFYVFMQPGPTRRTVFQVDLFSARGRMPATLREASEREKDIRYSSRTRIITALALERRNVARAAQRLMTKLPERLRSDPDAQALAQLNDGCGTGVDVVHLIYRSKDYENDAKDYEFSRWTMREHWSSGYADVLQTLRHPAWRGRGPGDGSVRVFDLVERDRERDASAKGTGHAH
jgi:NTE family protein